MSRINYNESYRTTGGLQRFDCLAWVNFNGTGTVAIRASGNVSSITDNGTGDYTVNFTTALPDANYSTVALPSSDSGAQAVVARGYSQLAGSVRFQVLNATQSGFLDSATNSVAIFR